MSNHLLSNFIKRRFEHFVTSNIKTKRTKDIQFDKKIMTLTGLIDDLIS
jgi:hypothetical protein